MAVVQLRVAHADHVAYLRGEQPPPLAARARRGPEIVRQDVLHPDRHAQEAVLRVVRNLEDRPPEHLRDDPGLQLLRAQEVLVGDGGDHLAGPVRDPALVVVLLARFGHDPHQRLGVHLDLAPQGVGVHQAGRHDRVDLEREAQRRVARLVLCRALAVDALIPVRAVVQRPVQAVAVAQAGPLRWVGQQSTPETHSPLDLAGKRAPVAGVDQDCHWLSVPLHGWARVAVAGICGRRRGGLQTPGIPVQPAGEGQQGARGEAGAPLAESVCERSDCVHLSSGVNEKEQALAVWSVSALKCA